MILTSYADGEGIAVAAEDVSVVRGEPGSTMIWTRTGIIIQVKESPEEVERQRLEELAKPAC